MKTIFSIILVSSIFLLVLGGNVSAATITSCGTVTEDSVLGSDLTSNDTCLSIQANDVILDCDGHSITGNGTDTGIAIYGDGVTVKNCRIENYLIGIAPDYYSTISNNVITLNDIGIVLFYAYNNAIVNNTISLNNFYSIDLELHAGDNLIYHNNIMDPIFDDTYEGNFFHHPTLLEGNYWSDYTGVDDGSGTGKHAIAGDGIGDTLIPHPYAAYDNYPFINPIGGGDPTPTNYRPIAWEEGSSEGYYSNPTYAYDDGYNDTSTYALIGGGENVSYGGESLTYIWDIDSDGTSNATLYYTWEISDVDYAHGNVYIDAWNYSSGNWDTLRFLWDIEALETRSLNIGPDYINSTGEIKIDFFAWFSWSGITEIVLYDVYISEPSIPDTTPPDTTITSGPPDPINSSSATFEFESTETGSTFECELDGSGYSACTSPMTYTGLSDGTHIFNVRATDQAGNTDTTPASYSWTIDTIRPVVTITSPKKNKTYHTGYVELTFYANEPTRWAGYKLDNGPRITVTGGSTTLTNLSNGFHTVEVSMADLGGKHGKATVRFKIRVRGDPKK